MESVNLFALAAEKSRWLAARQATIAGNVANANTPGYVAKDIQSFDRVLDGRGVTMSRTATAHLAAFGSVDAGAGTAADDIATLTRPGGKVVLENEMLKAGEIRRDFELNTAVVKAFHRMLLLASKA